MTNEKNANYTSEQEREVVRRYHDSTPIAQLAAQFGKSEKSIIAKLVQLGEYKPAQRNGKEKRKTKLDMIREIERIINVPVGSLDSLEKGTYLALFTLYQPIITTFLDLH